MRILYFLSVCFVFFSCTTIEIKEADIFDNHATLTPQTYQHPEIRLVERNVGTSDGELLNSWIFYRPDAQATVLYAGGTGFLMVKSRMLVTMFQELPVNLVLFDYRGYGLSSGVPTIGGLKKDMEAIVSVVRQDSVLSVVPLLIHGHSMGSFLASDAALRFLADGLVLESPISEPQQWVSGIVPRFLRPFIRFSFEDAIASESNILRVKEWDNPLLIMNGTHDEITPMFMTQALYDAAKSSYKTKVEVPGGGHNDLPSKSEYRLAYQEFIRLVVSLAD